MKNIRSAAAMAVLAGAAVLAANAAEAHALSLEECAEGSDFIKNAALARDEGMQERQFVAQFQADVQALQRLPAELRWFVQDKDDEVFLLSAVQEVFRKPKPATVHQAQFAPGKNVSPAPRRRFRQFDSRVLPHVSDRWKTDARGHSRRQYDQPLTGMLARKGDAGIGVRPAHGQPDVIALQKKLGMVPAEVQQALGDE